VASTGFQSLLWIPTGRVAAETVTRLFYELPSGFFPEPLPRNPFNKKYATINTATIAAAQSNGCAAKHSLANSSPVMALAPPFFQRKQQLMRIAARLSAEI
jgi:hypothetical protein